MTRRVTLELVAEAQQSGASLRAACETAGISVRTVQRWRAQGDREDGRAGPQRSPRNALSPAERRYLLDVVNTPKYRSQSPKQIVPSLADEGVYLASESTIYRLLREEGQASRRSPDRPPTPRAKPSLVATGPNQVWSWDITYLKRNVKGSHFYLYVVMDIWSRKIVGWAVHPTESAEHSSKLIREICLREGVEEHTLVLHSDNGGPMKGATMLATLQWLGVVPSFSRPQVKDDNPFSESLFRTLKYRPGYPKKPFKSVEEARAWVQSFVDWYNHEHRHSGIQYVTPAQRHRREDVQILERRRIVYERAKQRRPERWTGATRNWDVKEAVFLNPKLEPNTLSECEFA